MERLDVGGIEVTAPPARALGRKSGLYVCTGMQPGLQARWFNHEDHEGHEEGSSVVNEPLFNYHTHPLLLFRESGASFALDFESGRDIFARLSMDMIPPSCSSW